MYNAGVVLQKTKPIWHPAAAQAPQGLWWLYTSVTVLNAEGTVRVADWESTGYDFTFECNFHDSLEPCGGQICVYNLSDSTIQKIQPGMITMVRGGYGMHTQSDQGAYMTGIITNVLTSWDGSDKCTEISATNLSHNIGTSRVQQTFTAPVAASFILGQLCAQSGLPLGEFSLRGDHIFTQTLTLEGEIGDLIDEMATLCGVWAFVVQGGLFVRDLRRDPRRNIFVLNEISGLIETPEVWCETRHSRYSPQDEPPEVLQGYRVRTLLNHRLTPGAGVHLDARYAKGYFTVKECRHVYNGCGGYTEAVLLA